MLAMKPIGIDPAPRMSPQSLRRLLDRLHSMWQNEVNEEEFSPAQLRIHTERMVDFMCRDPTTFEMMDKFREKYFPREEGTDRQKQKRRVKGTQTLCRCSI